MVGWDLSASLSLLHNVGWNDAWCCQRCGASGTRLCHVLLMVKNMVVTVDRRCSKLVVLHQFRRKNYTENFAIAVSEPKILITLKKSYAAY